MLRRISVSFILVSIFSSFTIAQVPEKDKVIAGAERAWEKTIKAYVAPGPGCSVAVSINGQVAFEKAFGMAEMEHGIPNTPQTIFESGSVAKQFTAAAVVLLSLDGKLRLDDPVRKYIPELPDYGKPLTIRHILTHTAGLRDWGSVMALTGAGRGDRVITQNIALDVIVRQKALDFEPGAEYSYSNSGYQLAAIIVERVSGQKFGDFTRDRLFKPLGMNNSSWRDDYRRLVSGRAQGYSRSGPNATWMLNMPIMNVVGNGGMLTTVGDWLKWNAMLDSRSMGGPLVDALETQGVLNDGRKINYALGLTVDTYKGLKDISHGGSTAGYQTFLARYPEKKLSVAVLCNGPSPGAGALAANITDEILGPFSEPLQAQPQPEAIELAPSELQKYVSLWRDEKTHAPVLMELQNGVLRMSGVALRPLKDGSFQAGTGPVRYIFKLDESGRPAFAERSVDGEISRAIAETEWKPTSADLASFAGDWYSDEAGAAFTVAIEGDKASIKQRPTTSILLRPLYKDHFAAQGYVVWFTRDDSGKIDKLHVGGSRMRDMPFVRVR